MICKFSNAFLFAFAFAFPLLRAGKGRFSTVFQCRHTLSGEHAAVKVVEKSALDSREAEAMRTEIAILKLVNHPNIMRLREVFETRTHLYIVMKLVRGGDLFQRIKKRKWYAQTACAKE